MKGIEIVSTTNHLTIGTYTHSDGQQYIIVASANGVAITKKININNSHHDTFLFYDTAHK